MAASDEAEELLGPRREQGGEPSFADGELVFPSEADVEAHAAFPRLSIEQGIEEEEENAQPRRNAERSKSTAGSQALSTVGMTIALCNAVDAVETNAFGFLLVGYVDPFTNKRLDEDHSLSGVLASGVFIGMLLGGLVAGYAADRIGRRPVLILSMFINAISALLSALTPHFPGREVYWLLFFRILAGIGVGGSVPCAFSLMAEWSPVETRGFHLSMLNATWTIGSIFTALAAWLIMDSDDNSTTWPWFLFLCSLPAFLAIYLTHRHVTEAPQKTETLPSPILEPQNPIASLNLTKLSFIWFIQSFASYGVGTWIGDVFYNLGYKDPYAAALGFAIASVPGAILASLLIERIGRRALLSAGMLFAGVFAIFFSSLPRNLVFSLGNAFGFSLCITCAWVGLGALSSETFPFETRTTSMGIIAAFGRLGSITANLVNPYLLQNNAIMGVAGSILVFGATFSYCFLKDTTGKQI